MTVVPFTQCCSMLAVDSKTLRQWLKHSNFSLHPHPTDARVKCLTIEQVQQLATSHHRCIKQDAAPVPEQMGAPAPLVLGSPKPTQIQPESQLSPTRLSDSDLLQALFSLEATVTNLQQQVAGLALELLQERTLRYERRLQNLEVLVQSTERPQALQTIGELSRQENMTNQEHHQNPAQRCARPSLLPLIEYGARGTYVVLSPEEGELFLTPDSQDWFDWLATLSSFRFMGQQGRLSTYRNKGRSCWMAYRRIHSHRYEHTLGSTHDLTIDCLEQMAARLQSYVPSL